MSKHATSIDTGLVIRALASGAAAAALSADRQPRLVRGLGLSMAVAAGAWVGLAAAGKVGLPGSDAATSRERPEVPPTKAAGVGLGVFAVTAAASEAGLWGQRRFERWADDAFGHPRLAVGLVGGALSVVADVAERLASRD